MLLKQTFDKQTFEIICDKLASVDDDLKDIITTYGYPPFWQRAANFETLVHIILEQQVSLASAKAALTKLKEKLINITPENLLQLNDGELKACYFSRQKIIYSRHLATAILSGDLNLESLNSMNNDSIRTTLLQIKGIGNWTVDVYLMMALQRADLFPLGDIALIRSLKETKKLTFDISKEKLALVATKWKPYQTIAAYILWHAYLSKRIK